MLSFSPSSINYIIQIAILVSSFLASLALQKFFIINARKALRRIIAKYPKLVAFKIDIPHIVSIAFVPLVTLIVLSLARLVFFIVSINDYLLEKFSVVASIWLFFRILSFCTNGKRGDLMAFIVSWVTIIDDLDLIDTDKIDLLTFNFKVLGYTFAVNAIIKNILILYILSWIFKVVDRMINRFLVGSVEPTTLIVYNKVVQYIGYIIIGMIMLNIFGIDIQHIALVGSALTVGIGLGMQKIFANFMSSMILITEKSIKINDLIEFEDGSFGVVKEMNMRAVVFSSPDGKTIIVPNETMLTSKIKNLTFDRDSKVRLNLTFGVEFDHKAMSRAKILAVEVAKNNKFVYKDIEPYCVATSIEDYYFNLKLFFWIGNIDTLPSWSVITDQIMSDIIKGCEDNNINMPFPIQDLRIHKVD